MKFLLRSLYVLGGGVAVLLGVYAFWNAWATNQLESRLVALKEANMPVKLADLRKEVPPPEENAAVWLRRARIDLEAIDKEIGVKFDLSGPVTNEMALQMNAVLEAHRGGLESVHRAAECKTYNAEPDYGVPVSKFVEEQLMRIQLIRSAARALQYEAMVQLQFGKTDASLQTAVRMLELSNHLAEEPTLIAYLVRNAVVGMALARFHDLLAADLTSEQHELIERELSKLDMGEAFQKSLETERAFALEFVDELHTFAGPMPLSPPLKLQVIRLIDYLNIAHEAAKSDHLQFQQHISGLGNTTARAVLTAQVANCRITALIRSLRIVNEYQRQKPAELTNLKVEEDLWIDPFNGQRMNAVVQAGMLTVYSVGRNLRDDQGVVDPGKDADAGWAIPLND